MLLLYDEEMNEKLKKVGPLEKFDMNLNKEYFRMTSGVVVVVVVP